MNVVGLYVNQIATFRVHISSAVVSTKNSWTKIGASIFMQFSLVVATASGKLFYCPSFFVLKALSRFMEDSDRSWLAAWPPKKPSNMSVTAFLLAGWRKQHRMRISLALFEVFWELHKACKHVWLSQETWDILQIPADLHSSRDSLLSIQDLK